MKPYSWSCLACEESNPPGNLKCSRCGCPWQATATQVDVAREAYRRAKGLPPTVKADVLGSIGKLPLLLIGAAVLLLAGTFALIIGSNVSVQAFGGLLIALAALCASSYRKKPAT
jgi:hypothetical protein